MALQTDIGNSEVSFEFCILNGINSSVIECNGYMEINGSVPVMGRGVMGYVSQRTFVYAWRDCCSESC